MHYTFPDRNDHSRDNRVRKGDEGFNFETKAWERAPDKAIGQWHVSNLSLLVRRPVPPPRMLGPAEFDGVCADAFQAVPNGFTAPEKETVKEIVMYVRAALHQPGS